MPQHIRNSLPHPAVQHTAAQTPGDRYIHTYIYTHIHTYTQDKMLQMHPEFREGAGPHDSSEDLSRSLVQRGTFEFVRTWGLGGSVLSRHAANPSLQHLQCDHPAFRAMGEPELSSDPFVLAALTHRLTPAPGRTAVHRHLHLVNGK